VHALLAAGARVGDRSARVLAGRAHSVGDRPACERDVVDVVRGRVETALHGGSGVVHAAAEDGQAVHGVVDPQADEKEDGEREQRQHVADGGVRPANGDIGIEAHAGGLPDVPPNSRSVHGVGPVIRVQDRVRARLAERAPAVVVHPRPQVLVSFH
jgi:hypothetical protein